MITLDLPPNKQAIIERASQESGMTVEQYIISKIMVDKKEKTASHEEDIMSLFGCANSAYGKTAEEIDEYISGERDSGD